MECLTVNNGVLRLTTLFSHGIFVKLTFSGTVYQVLQFQVWTSWFIFDNFFWQFSFKMKMVRWQQHIVSKECEMWKHVWTVTLKRWPSMTINNLICPDGLVTVIKVNPYTMLIMYRPSRNPLNTSCLSKRLTSMTNCCPLTQAKYAH